MHFDALGELIQEHGLVDVVHTELLQDCAQVSQLNEFLFITFLLEKSHSVNETAEHSLILKKLGADGRQSLPDGNIESRVDALEMVKPSVQVDH